MLIVSLALIIYVYWGAFTNAGNKVYDEMDGFFPFFLIMGGVVLFVVFWVLVILLRREAMKLYNTQSKNKLK